MSDKKSHGWASGTYEYYIVEARRSCGEPMQHGGLILDKEWRRVHFLKAAIGAPTDQWIDPVAKQNGLLNYEAAIALAHWFLAEGGTMGSLCVETRLVKVKFIFKWETEEVGVGPAMSSIATLRATKFEPREAESK